MATDDDRREVARRLREKKAECEERGYPWMCDDLILALGCDHDYEAGDEIFDRLADLIEPGEPPYNLYTLYETVFHRSPRCWECIEDDEVDELVDALLDICNAPVHERIQRKQPSASATPTPLRRVTDASATVGVSQRDALLALEDEMFEGATGLAFISQLEKNEELQDLQSTMAKALMDYARRIREALGVER